MNKFLFTTLFLLIISVTSAFSQGRAMIGAGMDVFKTDNDGPFKKFQFGLEFNYFIAKPVTISGGFEAWSAPQSTYFTIGTRIYPIKPLFLRFRGILANYAEFALGAGYSPPITKRLKAEFTGDYYYNASELGLRAGLTFSF